MIQRKTANRTSKNDAFSLVEVAIAMGIAIFCLILIFGLLPVGINSNNAAIQQTAAANIARGIVADLQSTPSSSGTGTSPLFSFKIPPASASPTNTITSSTCQTLFFNSDGSTTGTVGASGNSGGSIPTYRAALGFNPPRSPNRYATAVRLLITWPALADGTANTWPSKYTGSFEINTALDRN